MAFKSLDDCAPDPADRANGVRYLVASASDIAWMSPQLGQWATWCNGGKPTPDASVVLGEQFANDDMTIIGVEDKPDGEIVFVLVYSRRDFSSELLGDVFETTRHAVARRKWVPADHRGRGIANAGTRFAHAESLRRGINGIWTFILVENTAAQRLRCKLGYEEVGLARIVTRFKRRYVGLRFDSSERWHLRRVPFERSGL